MRASAADGSSRARIAAATSLTSAPGLMSSASASPGLTFASTPSVVLPGLAFASTPSSRRAAASPSGPSPAAILPGPPPLRCHCAQESLRQTTLVPAHRNPDSHRRLSHCAVDAVLLATFRLFDDECPCGPSSKPPPH